MSEQLMTKQPERLTRKLDSLVKFPWAEKIKGVWVGKRPWWSETCPVCGRQMKHPNDRRGYGFAKAGFSRHISACYAKSLRELGLVEDNYDAELMAHPLKEI